MSRRWHNPRDLPVDRARQVAATYRDALRRVDPDACEAIDKAAVHAGEGWVAGELAIEVGEDLVTVARAAELVGRSTRWVYAWIERNPTVVKGRRPLRVRLDDVRTAASRRSGVSGVSGESLPAPIYV